MKKKQIPEDFKYPDHMDATELDLITDLSLSHVDLSTEEHYKIAKTLRILGYRKIRHSEVVLSKEDYDKLNSYIRADRAEEIVKEMMQAQLSPMIDELMSNQYKDISARLFAAFVNIYEANGKITLTDISRVLNAFAGIKIREE